MKPITTQSMEWFTKQTVIYSKQCINVLNMFEVKEKDNKTNEYEASFLYFSILGLNHYLN